MNLVTVRRRLNAPIPEFPEFTPLVGKNVEIIVREDTNSPELPYDFWNGSSAEELTLQQGIPPVTSLDQLRSSEDMSDAFDGFEETLAEWRAEPWRK